MRLRSSNLLEDLNCMGYTGNGSEMKKKEVFKQKVFDLYSGVLKGNRDSIEKFKALYLQKFPDNEPFTRMQGQTREERHHMMYLHLTK